jgi:enoyl-CoA hydratase/carnithine racemase
MAYQHIKTSIEDGVGIITINNPPVNALSQSVLSELSETFVSLQNDTGVRVIIITGQGKVFVAGADIKEIQNIKNHEEGMKFCNNGHRVVNLIENSSIPVIAVINGACLGGGNELAMSCHIRLAGKSARFGQPETNLGIIPGFGGTQRLLRLIGFGKALELNLTGDMVSAEEAKTLGLVNYVFPDETLLNDAITFAKKIAGKSRVATSFILKAMREGRNKPLADALELEKKLFSEILLTEDKKEGISAFLEKRKPSFKKF